LKAEEGQAALRAKAKDLLAKGQVALILGYGERTTGGARLLAARTPLDADRLVWNDRCTQNLATYLVREPAAGVIRSGGRVGIVAKGCDARSIVGLLQESQIKRETILVIGVVCDGVTAEYSAPGGIPSKCIECEWHTPPLYDELVGDKAAVEHKPGDALAEVRRIEEMTEPERWAYWTGLLSRCIKCYACRQACPLCYCKECITEKSRPQWIDKTSGVRGNLAYHFIRALHLAGRCVGCEECRRACPMGIPVDLLSRYLTRKAEAAFGYKPGVDPKQEPFFVTFKDTDPEDFIR
jgi:formate dehydrogenase subunit beta